MGVTLISILVMTPSGLFFKFKLFFKVFKPAKKNYKIFIDNQELNREEMYTPPTLTISKIVY